MFAGETVRVENVPLTTTRHGDPDRSWWTFSYSPVRNEAGEIAGLLNVSVDTTAQVRAETALRECEARHRTLFESMDEAYAVVEMLKDDAGRWADFRFIAANPAFMAHTGMPHPVGQAATELLGTPNPRRTELYGHALDTGKALRVEESEATLGITSDLNIFAVGS